MYVISQESMDSLSDFIPYFKRYFLDTHVWVDDLIFFKQCKLLLMTRLFERFNKENLLSLSKTQSGRHIAKKKVYLNMSIHKISFGVDKPMFMHMYGCVGFLCHRVVSYFSLAAIISVQAHVEVNKIRMLIFKAERHPTCWNTIF